jgi:GT2 family glycosyltransferase/glycosyltransferase involved in cell wall biosynthesis
MSLAAHPEAFPFQSRVKRVWGSSLRQRLRLAPLHAAIVLADRLPVLTGHRRTRHTAWRAGLSVIIPDRDAPELLGRALQALELALADFAEPCETIVVTNGAPSERYAGVSAAHPAVRFVHHEQPLGFSAAVGKGLAHARYDGTLLLNNDMTLESAAIRELAACRGDDVFAIGAQIMQRSADGRREETGFTDWYADASGVRVFHAPPGAHQAPTPSLCASGGAGLFRTDLLRRYAHQSACYDPFYWEDVEWGLRAQGEGYRVLFCPAARANHVHRATTARFYGAAELERIVERNRMLCDLRNALTHRDATRLMQRVCDQPYASQRELSRLSVAARVFLRRRAAVHERLPFPPQPIAGEAGATHEIVRSYSFGLRGASPRPRLLMITPFCVFPPRHGGARRVEGLLHRLRAEFDVVLVSDEASLYDARSFAYFEDLRAVHLVQRGPGGEGNSNADLGERMRTHCHAALERTVRDALRRYRPHLVQVEHVELAMLSTLRGPGQRWILGLHDAFEAGDFRDATAAVHFREHVLGTYDAATVCSSEDGDMVEHPRTVCVPNGTRRPDTEHAPSMSAQLLFMGPFRYAQNLDGIRHFLRVAYPAIKAAVPNATLVVLGGDGAPQATAGDRVFAQPDVSVLGHREDIGALLRASALTVNPLSGTRGSSLKVIESLAAGRACVSTIEGARGFADAGLPGLVTVKDVAAMVEPIIGLLGDPARRQRIERPDAARLAPFEWQRCAQIQSELYHSLLGAADA